MAIQSNATQSNWPKYPWNVPVFLSEEGEGLPQFHHSQYFLYKLTISWENIKFHRHRVQNVLGSRIGLKNRLFDKKSVVFHRAESRWCQVCNLLCQFLTRSQFGRSPACEKWTEKNGKGEQEVGLEMCGWVKNGMREGFCGRKEWARNIVIWQRWWVKM